MYSTELTNEDRISIAQRVSEEINAKFDLSLFEMSLNDLNQNICIKMVKSEATEDVLRAITLSLCINYHTTFVFKSTPIVTKGTAEPEAMTVSLSALASGSYMDNPMQRKTAIYHFEQI